MIQVTVVVLINEVNEIESKESECGRDKICDSSNCISWIPSFNAKFHYFIECFWS